MAPVKVVVSGSGNIERQPELGIVSVRVQSTGPDQAGVSAEVRNAAQDIQAQVRQLATPQHADYRAPSPAVDAAVTRWSSSAMSTRSWWEDREDKKHTKFYGAQTHVGATSGYSSDSSQHDKKRKTKLYEASVTITATFRDFDGLSDFTTNMSLVPLASVYDVEWRLTDETQAQLRDEVIKKSYRDALAKARAFAEAMDKKSVRPVQVTHGHDQPRRMLAFGAARFGQAGGSTEEEQRLTYLPEDVSYDVDCEVTFELE